MQSTRLFSQDGNAVKSCIITIGLNEIIKEGGLDYELATI
jgi:hypothetical protein